MNNITFSPIQMLLIVGFILAIVKFFFDVTHQPQRALTKTHEQNMIQLYEFVKRVANNESMPTHLWNEANDIIDDVQQRTNARDQYSLENKFGPLAEESLLEFAKGVQRHAQAINDEALRAQAVLIIEKCRHQGIAYRDRAEIGL